MSRRAVPAVVVSIPAWQARDTIARAVGSVLAQTVEDFLVVVTNDGGDPDDLAPLGEFDDPRLVIVAGATNRGRYAIDHDIVSTANARWFATVDADDFVEPDWLESMLEAADRADVVMAPHYVHGLRKRDPELVPVVEFTGEFRWHAHMGACLWSVEWLRHVAATTDAVRIGWDSVMTGVPFLTGRRREIDRATYHRVRREGSLTTARETGMGSPARQDVQRLLSSLWVRAVQNPGDVPRVLRSVGYAQTAFELVPRLPHTEWSMAPAALVELDAFLWRKQPRRVVEYGSGLSTVVLARYARQTRANVDVYEHDRRFLDDTRRKLDATRLGGAVTLHHARLEGNPPTYAAPIPEGLDFALIDGPPARTGGRAATLPELLPYAVPEWEAWLDDAERPEERAALREWRDRLGVAFMLTDIPRGVARVTPKRSRRPKVDATGVVLAILTGYRPELLAQTLGSLPPGLLETAHVIVRHDGGDPETRRVLERYGEHFDEWETTTQPPGMMDTIGENWSALAAAAAGKGLHFLPLEDDWQFVTLDPDWLTNARRALDFDDVAQVRLRHASEKTRHHNMATGRPVEWQPDAFGFVADAHLTVNPSLCRVSDLPRMFPAASEREMQQNAHRAGLRRVVQTYPGAFVHRGDDSLRERLGSP